MLLEAVLVMVVDALALGLVIAGGVYVISLVYRVVQAGRHMHRLARLAEDQESERVRQQWYASRNGTEPLARNVGGMGWDDEAT